MLIRWLNTGKNYLQNHCHRTPVSYSGSLKFKYRSGDPLSWFRFLVVLLSYPRQINTSILPEVRPQWPLSRRFQFIIHNCYTILTTKLGTALLNKKKIINKKWHAIKTYRTHCTWNGLQHDSNRIARLVQTVACLNCDESRMKS
jgi:hypothetical protein